MPWAAHQTLKDQDRIDVDLVRLRLVHLPPRGTLVMSSLAQHKCRNGWTSINNGLTFVDLDRIV
eukprot:4955949-Amphidinium_carterae.1